MGNPAGNLRIEGAMSVDGVQLILNALRFG
jgi:hypothetical protein